MAAFFSPEVGGPYASPTPLCPPGASYPVVVCIAAVTRRLSKESSMSSDEEGTQGQWTPGLTLSSNEAKRAGFATLKKKGTRTDTRVCIYTQKKRV